MKSFFRPYGHRPWGIFRDRVRNAVECRTGLRAKIGTGATDVEKVDHTRRHWRSSSSVVLNAAPSAAPTVSGECREARREDRN